MTAFDTSFLVQLLLMVLMLCGFQAGQLYLLMATPNSLGSGLSQHKALERCQCGGGMMRSHLQLQMKCEVQGALGLVE